MTRILVLDNYDSFVFNLVQYLQQLGAETVVHRNDTIAPDDIDGMDVDGVLVSPGPGTPQAAGISVALVKACGDRKVPMLGVCLGHQALAVAYGGVVSRAPELLHGKTSLVDHDGTGVLAGLPDPFAATRYHSLAAEERSLPAELVVTARSPSGVVMAMRHATLQLHGVQFHPESVLSQSGHILLANWLQICGHDTPPPLAPSLAHDVETLRLAAQP